MNNWHCRVATLFEIVALWPEGFQTNTHYLQFMRCKLYILLTFQMNYASFGDYLMTFVLMYWFFWFSMLSSSRFNFLKLFATQESTLFSKRSAHENRPIFLRSLGHQPQPRVILILSIGLESNSQKTLCQNLKNCREFLNRVFCILLSRPIDKIDMTLGHGQWPRVTRRTGVNQCAILLEKSVNIYACMSDITSHEVTPVNKLSIDSVQCLACNSRLQH